MIMDLCRRDRSITRNALRLFSILLLAAPATAWSQGGAVPTYISSLADFEVRGLTGAYAPTNGTSTMESVTPTEWLNNENLAAVITAWAGGAKGVGTKLYVQGGGHNDSANNGLYVFDFSGADAPTGWETPLVISPRSAVCGGCDAYADGKPTATHTGDTMVFAHHNNHIYRFGGAWYNTGGGWTDATFKYNVNTQQWTQLADWPRNATSPVTLYDPATGKIYVKHIASPSGYFFRTDTETWSGDVGVSGYGAGYYVTGAWDTSRNRGIMVGENLNVVVDIDFVNETVSSSSLSASGASSILGVPGISVLYDPQADVYWMYGGRTLNSSGADYDTLYAMNADGPPWTVTAHQLSGDAIQYSNGMHGSYGRFILMNEWRAIGMVQSHDAPAFVVKLPGQVSAVKAPRPPSDFAAN